jgi:hypothetical protein
MPIFIRKFLMLFIMISVIIILFFLYVMMMYLVLMPCLQLDPLMLIVEIGLGVIMLFLMCLGNYPLVQLLFIIGKRICFEKINHGGKSDPNMPNPM